MDIARQLRACRVRRLDHPAPCRYQLGPAVGVRDGGRDQLGKAGELVLDPRRKRVLLNGGHRHHAPQSSLDLDRRASGRPRAALAREQGDAGGIVPEPVDARGLLGLEHQRRDVAPADRNALADPLGLAESAPAANVVDRLVRRVAAEQSQVDAGKKLRHLLSDGGKHDRGSYSAGDQRGHASQAACSRPPPSARLSVTSRATVVS